MLERLTWRKLEYVIGLCLALAALFVYILTLCPTVSFIDSGELATVAYTLGIAHPTGYPLFSLVGWVFAHLPLGFRVIYQLNLMAAFFCSAGVFVFFRFLVFLLSQVLKRESKNLVDNSMKISWNGFLQIFIPAIFGTLVLAFSETYWSQAVSIEVYPLHIFLLTTILFLFTRAITITSNHGDQKLGQNEERRYWLSFAFVLGLSFTNHMTTILLAPGFLYLFFTTFGFNARAWRQLQGLVLPFILGLSVYFYLPLRASTHPLLNWGNPVDFEHFMWHFSGKVYRVWIFSSTESAAKQMKYFFDTLPDEFAYFPLLVCLPGLWSLWKNHRKVFMFTLLLFLGCLLYSINYDIHDIDSYFLLAYITVAIWSAIGLRYLVSVIENQTVVRGFAIASLASILFLVGYNFKQVDESKNYLVEEYTRDMFKSIAPNGIIISYQWDYFVSAAYYFQLVEHHRPDVIVIDKELLRRSWYYQQLQTRYPWLIAQSKKELDAFLTDLGKFERNLPYNPNLIEYHYNNLIHSIIEKNISSRPVYVTQELEAQYTVGYSRLPSGLAFRLYSDSLMHEIPKPNFSFHPPPQKNTYTDGIKALYAQAYTNNAIYANLLGKNGDAFTYVSVALEIEPDLREAIYLKDKLTHLK